MAATERRHRTFAAVLLASTVALSDCADPIVLLDEIEKAETGMQHDPRAALYSLWDDSAAMFMDDGLKFPLNFSGIRWIATCNDVGKLHAALLSRCTVVEVPAPTRDQAAGIARRIYNDLISHAPWGKHFEGELRANVVDVLSRQLPRDVKKSLIAALGLAALRGQPYITEHDLPQAPHIQSIGFL